MKASEQQLHPYWHASEAVSSRMSSASYLSPKSHFSFPSLVVSSCSLVIPKRSCLWGSVFFSPLTSRVFLGLSVPLLSSQLKSPPLVIHFRSTLVLSHRPQHPWGIILYKWWTILAAKQNFSEQSGFCNIVIISENHLLFAESRQVSGSLLCRTQSHVEGSPRVWLWPFPVLEFHA